MRVLADYFGFKSLGLYKSRAMVVPCYARHYLIFHENRPHWWHHFLCGSSLLKEANHHTFRTTPQERWSVGMSMA